MRNYERLVERVSQLKKLSAKVEEELSKDIEKCLKAFEQGGESFTYLQSINELLSINWKLNKNYFWLRSQLRGEAEGVQE